MNIDQVNPQLRKTFARIPPVPFHNRFFLRVCNMLMRFQHKPGSMFGVSIREERSGDAGIRIYTPEGELSGAGLVWIHGGGYVIGTAAINDRECARYARDLNMIVVSVDYRLAPQHPFPAALDDCFAAWQWFQQHAPGLGVDPERIAVSGQSAGGGLAATLAQRVHDAGGVQPAGQALFCPMLDDRTAARTELDAVKHRMWSNRNNRGGWSYYLGQPPGAPELPPYAAASRRRDLSGLPTAWIGVGDIDLFCEENRRYAARLQEAGVECELEIAPGAPHGFESVAPDAPVTRALLESNYRFLRKVLAPGGKDSG